MKVKSVYLFIQHKVNILKTKLNIRNIIVSILLNLHHRENKMGRKNTNY